MTPAHSFPGPAVPAASGGHGTESERTGPGVPLSIWPDAPAPHTGHGHGPCSGPVTIWAAAQVVATFTRPGDLVAAPDGSPAVIQAAAAARRRVLGVISAIAGGEAGLDEVRSRIAPAARPFARLRPGGPDLLLAPGDPDAGQAALAIAGCHGPGCQSAGSDSIGGPDLLYAACERVLAPGGVLGILTDSPAYDGQLTDLAGHAVASARAAGLVYAQHIVLVHAAINDDQLAPDPAAGPAELPGGSRIHSDLLVFTKPGGSIHA